MRKIFFRIVKIISIILVATILLFSVVIFNNITFKNSMIEKFKNLLIESPIINLYLKLFRDQQNFDDDHVITSLDHGMKIIVNKHDRCVCWFVRITGHWDSNEVRVIEHIVKPNFNIIEVGANFGVHTLRMAQLIGKHGKIYAFEANPKVSKYLKKSVEINALTELVTVYEKAAGDHTGTVFLDFGLENIGGGHLTSHPNKRSIKTAMVRLDDLLAGQKIDLLKIDAEGCEAKILKGANKILKANPNIILMLEWAPNLLKAQGTDPIAFANYLQKIGFNVWRIGKKSAGEPSLVNITYDQLNSLENGDLVFSRNKIN